MAWTRSTSFSAFAGVVALAACGRTVTIPGAGGKAASTTTGTASTGTTKTGATTGTAMCSYDFTNSACPQGGPPSTGSPCTTPGLCCGYLGLCDHAGGFGPDIDRTCVGGTWR